MNRMQQENTIRHIFLTFLQLGLTAFGGPVAHLGYFRTEFVERQKWLDDKHYADIVALCQFLPGPASSQVGLSLGYIKGGYSGAFAAWAGFTLPSALALMICALLLNVESNLSAGFLQGLKIVAVAIVAQALMGMAKQLCPDVVRKSIAVLATCTTLLLPLIMPAALGQLVVITITAIFGFLYYRKKIAKESNNAQLLETQTSTISKISNINNVGNIGHINNASNAKKTAFKLLWIFFILLLALPVLAYFSSWESIAIFDTYYRTGSLVFGGGHVVLPMLQAEIVNNGWVNNDTFLAGYGLTQAVPGPLFTFASFLGSASSQTITGICGGLCALAAIFLPSFLLVLGIMPLWTTMRTSNTLQALLMGVNAGVVGVLSAAFYDPIVTSGIHHSSDVALALLAFAGLVWWKMPPWLVVLLSACMGWLLL